MKLTKLFGGCLTAVLLSGSVAVADRPAAEVFREQIPVAQPVPAPVAAVECGWDARLSVGAPIYMFNDEDTNTTGGMYLDVFPCDLPLNLRVGAEVRHISLDQPEAMNYAGVGEDHARITYVRIPFAAEYVVPVMEQTNLYIGGGPDLIRSANDISDWTVGGHLDARLQYEFENNMSVAVEGGYMWSKISDGKGTVDMSGAYIIPTIGYKF